MNQDCIKLNFPIFSSQTKKEKLFVYLDNAATTQKPSAVIDAICNFYKTTNANIHRGLYSQAEQATTLYESSREEVKEFINAEHCEEIIFTKGTTESINLVASSWAAYNLKKGDSILLSQVEHHANLLPWIELSKKIGVSIRYIPYDKETKKLNLKNLDLSGIKLLAVQHTSNVLGNVWDDDFLNLKNLIKRIKTLGGKTLLDAAQSIAHTPINIQELDVDFLAFSGHKIFAPTGIGVLYARKNLHHSLYPYQVGGSMITNATYSNAVWAPMPHLLEAGTPPISAAIGLKNALIFFKKNIPFNWLVAHETALCTLAAQKLAKIPNLHIVTNHANPQLHQHIVSFYHEKIHAHDIASLLGEKNISVRAGHHCAQPLIDLLKIPALVRISVAAYTTPQDIEVFIREIKAAITLLL